MNKQRDIPTGPSVIFSHALSLRRGSKLKSKIGFTLVELLVIVGIIALLTGILLPSLNKFRLAAAKAKTQSAINLIDGACRYYSNDFDDKYPPSQDATYSNWYGGQLLVLFLTGYGPDPTDNGEPGANLATDDGVEGYGFRLAKRGDVYGPYNGSEQLQTKKVKDRTNNENVKRPVFVDTFGDSGNPILYYRWTGPNYDSSHNTGGPPTDTALNDYAKNAAVPAAYYRTDFILISSGNNEQWENPCGIDNDGVTVIDSDDVTNFFNE